MSGRQEQTSGKSLSLLQKGALFLALPVLVQVVLEFVYVRVQSDADHLAARAGIARDLSIDIEGLIEHSIAATSRADVALATGTPQESRLEGDIRQAKIYGTQLKDNFKDSPADCRRADEIIAETEKIVEACAQAAKADGDKRSALEDAITAEEDKLSAIQQELLRSPLRPHVENRKEDADRRQAQVISLAVLTAVNILLLIAIGGIFLRNVVGKLRLMLDNNRRLAASQPLHPMLSGSDEIAQLDSGFHDMASALQDTLSRQRALVENARDVLWTLDDDLKILAVNTAAIQVIGYDPENLIGKNLEELVPGDRFKQMVEQLLLAVQGKESKPFETVILRSDKYPLDVLWSANWSDDQEVLICVAHDLSERKAAERLREETVQMVSHDLRTPLSAISGFHQLMEAGILGDLNNQGKHLLSMSRGNSQRMLTLVNDLLDIEKMDSGQLRLEPGEVSLRKVIEQAIHSVQTLANAKKIHLSQKDTDVIAYADEGRLVQVLVNLLSNAVKFSGDGTSVYVDCRLSGENAMIAVNDQGPGIPVEAQASVFDRFKQLGSLQSQRRGSGLGLAICKSLIELHGGKIGVTSEVGKGSTFWFFIPTRPQGNVIDVGGQRMDQPRLL